MDLAFLIQSPDHRRRWLTYRQEDFGPRTGVVKIGRDQKCHIAITSDDAVARMHAVLEISATTIDLIDLGSGTRVEEAPGKWVAINKRSLFVGSVFQIGSTLIRIIPLHGAIEPADRILPTGAQRVGTRTVPAPLEPLQPTRGTGAVSSYPPIQPSETGEKSREFRYHVGGSSIPSIFAQDLLQGARAVLPEEVSAAAGELYGALRGAVRRAVADAVRYARRVEAEERKP